VEIRVITPVTTEGFTRVEDFDDVARADTTVSVTNPVTGPPSIESEYDEAFAVPGTVIRMIEAEREGADAIVIDCMGDPGLAAGREAVDIPVVGASQVAMHTAAMVAHNFSIVTVLETLRPMFENIAATYGLTSKLASVRSVEIPVLELDKDPERLIRALVDESIKALEQDGAHSIVFGCTGMKGCAVGLKSGLSESGLTMVPVIDPVAAAVKVAEALVDLRLTHSRLTYASPRQKPLTGYEVPARESVTA
jgi:allantoin racemase